MYLNISNEITIGKVGTMYPERIICLTEETVEILYLLGEEKRIVGISRFVERPIQAKKNHPVISSFINANFNKIAALQPDLIIGFSDIQKDIARELIEGGFNVLITNQRTIEEILNNIILIGSLVGRNDAAQVLVESIKNKLLLINQKIKVQSKRPLIYFEEWDEPKISAIRWVSEIIEYCGGIDIFSDRSRGKLAKERFVTSNEVIDRNPDIILACWCGKKVDLESFHKRDGWNQINAVRNNKIYELAPEVFLQPGPGLFSGIDSLVEIIDGA